jgi:hypothetical protein
VLKFDNGDGNGDLDTSPDTDDEVYRCREDANVFSYGGREPDDDDTDMWYKSYCLSGSVAPGSRWDATNPGEWTGGASFYSPGIGEDDQPDWDFDQMSQLRTAAYPGECGDKYQTVSGWIRVYPETLLKVIVYPDRFGDFIGNSEVKVSIHEYDPALYTSTTGTSTTMSPLVPQCNGVYDQSTCLPEEEDFQLCGRDDANGEAFRSLCPATCTYHNETALPAGVSAPCVDAGTCNGKYDDQQCRTTVSLVANICSINPTFVGLCPVTCSSCANSTTTTSTISSTTTTTTIRVTETRTRTTTTTTETDAPPTPPAPSCNSLLDDEYCNDDILPLCDAEFEDLRLQMRALCPVLCDACEPEVAFTYPELDCADKDEFEYKVALALATVLPNEIKAESVVTYCGDAPDIDVPTDVPTENRRRSVTGLTVVVTAIDDASAATIVAAVTDGTPSGEALNVTLDSVADTFYYPSLVVRTTSTSTSSTSTSTSTSTTTIIYDPCNAGEFRSTSEPFTNGTCTACPVGTYQTGQTYATQCNSYSACSSGQYRPNPDADASTFAFCTP